MFEKPLCQTVLTQIRLYRSSLFWVHTVCFYIKLNLSVMLGNYLQQSTSVDDIFRCIIFLGALRVNVNIQTVCKGYQQMTVGDRVKKEAVYSHYIDRPKNIQIFF